MVLEIKGKHYTVPCAPRQLPIRYSVAHKDYIGAGVRNPCTDIETVRGVDSVANHYDAGTDSVANHYDAGTDARTSRLHPLDTATRGRGFSDRPIFARGQHRLGYLCRYDEYCVPCIVQQKCQQQELRRHVFLYSDQAFELHG